MGGSFRGALLLGGSILNSTTVLFDTSDYKIRLIKLELLLLMYLLDINDIVFDR